MLSTWQEHRGLFYWNKTMSKIHKLPAMQFYVGDWRKDPGVQALDFHDRGVWFELICLMHESEERGKLMLNGAAMPEDAISRLLGLDKQILTTTLTKLLTYGVASTCEETGAITCRRMIRDENLRKTRAGCGKLGGNPILLNQKSTTGVKQKSTPSSSVSSSSSSSSSISSNTDTKKKEARPTLEQIKEYMQTIALPESDAEWLYDKWEGNGYKNGGKAIVSWQATIRTWKRMATIFPSQKQVSSKQMSFGMKPSIQDRSPNQLKAPSMLEELKKRSTSYKHENTND